MNSPSHYLYDVHITRINFLTGIFRYLPAFFTILPAGKQPLLQVGQAEEDQPQALYYRAPQGSSGKDGPLIHILSQLFISSKFVTSR